VVSESSNKLLIFTLLLIFGFITPLSSQTETEESLLEEQRNSTASELLEQLQSLRRRPIDLNRVTLQKLQSLPILSPVQARNIIHERSQNGLFRSWSDFQKRMDLDNDQSIHLSPYFTVSHRKPVKKTFFRLRWRHLRRLQKTSGYESGTYLGSPWKGVQRASFSCGQVLRGGLLMEKDQGEPRWNDHLVGYMECKYLPCHTRLLVGNFRVEVGQGLVLWGPYGLSKGADPVAPVKKRSRGFVGYVTSDENRYLTGGAIEIKRNSLCLTLLTSRKWQDAALNSDGTVKSLTASGLHRTESEIDKKKRLKETLFGGRITRSWSWGTAGVTGWWSRYSKEIKRTDPFRYRFDFQGDQNHVFGLDVDLFFHRLNLSGEIAKCSSSGWALIGNSILDLGNASFVVSYRRYDPNFQNPHSHSFGSDQVRNEEGFYFGLTVKITKSTQLRFYYDAFRKPWRTYYTPIPTRGDDLFVQLDKKFSPALAITLRARFRRGEKLETGTTSTGLARDLIQDRNHHLYRFVLQYRPSPRLKLRSRLETVNVSYPKIWGKISCPSHAETGLLIYQDLWIQPIPRLTITARWITFDTEAYDSRIYEFEGDLPGLLTIQPLYGKGSRWYLLLRYQTTRLLQLAAKFSSTTHEGVSSWGSGHDQLQGDTEHHLGVQVDLKL
jgi:hypothetical protein